MGIGSFLARIFIATCFIGAFYSSQHLTIYAYLAEPFGSAHEPRPAHFI